LQNSIVISVWYKHDKDVRVWSLNKHNALFSDQKIFFFLYNVFNISSVEIDGSDFKNTFRFNVMQFN